VKKGRTRSKKEVVEEENPRMLRRHNGRRLPPGQGRIRAREEDAKFPKERGGKKRIRGAILSPGGIITCHRFPKKEEHRLTYERGGRRKERKDILGDLCPHDGRKKD